MRVPRLRAGAVTLCLVTVSLITQASTVAVIVPVQSEKKAIVYVSGVVKREGSYGFEAG